MQLTLECEQQGDGRRLAEVVGSPMVSAYGTSANAAMAKAEALALRALAERIEQDESGPQSVNISFIAAGVMAIDPRKTDSGRLVAPVG